MGPIRAKLNWPARLRPDPEEVLRIKSSGSGEDLSGIEGEDLWMCVLELHEMRSVERL